MSRPVCASKPGTLGQAAGGGVGGQWAFIIIQGQVGSSYRRYAAHSHKALLEKKLTLLDNDSLLVAPMRGHPLDPLDAPGGAPVSREAAQPDFAVGAREGIVIVQVEHLVAAAVIVAVAAPSILFILPLDLYRQ